MWKVAQQQQEAPKGNEHEMCSAELRPLGPQVSWKRNLFCLWSDNIDCGMANAAVKEWKSETIPCSWHDRACANAPLNDEGSHSLSALLNAKRGTRASRKTVLHKGVSRWIEELLGSPTKSQ